MRNDKKSRGRKVTWLQTGGRCLPPYSLRYSNKFKLKVRVNQNGYGHGGIKDGVYIASPGKMTTEHLKIKVPHQYVYVKKNECYVIVYNTAKVRNVLPSGIPFMMLLVNEKKVEKTPDRRMSTMQCVNALYANNVAISEEDKQLRENFLDTAWAKIETKHPHLTQEEKDHLREILKKNPVFPVPGKEFTTTNPVHPPHRIAPQQQAQQVLQVPSTKHPRAGSD
ncbi:hypothetical protein RvY_03130 [Ramazzottius varieornatus]|uniref:Uncharacterized protein n=1 Tax=Ramazzottius varieornatus TaxID=947166 RepID=A0A1D1UM00_RAMVA|nr:hypothetical protein RvY_03130 [Ramazzottius varieornatus]